MANQPLSLQWLVHIRDHADLTTAQMALASLLVTYGQGKNIFVSMTTLARVSGITRPTLRKARDGLIAMGLLEDLGEISNQVHRYRLTVPSQGGQELTRGGQELTRGGQELTTKVVSSYPQHQDLDQDLDQQLHHPDDGAEEDLSESKADLEQDARDNLGTVSQLLGVLPGKINVPALASQLHALSRVVGATVSVSEILDTYPADDPVWLRWRDGRSPVGRMINDLTRNLTEN